MGSIFGGGSDSYSQEEAARQQKIKQGTAAIDKAFAGFDDPFFQGRARAYTEFGMPQVEDQFTKASDQLKYALARQYGTTQTSEAARRQAELTKEYIAAKADVANKAQTYANQARSDVERERSSLMSDLSASADPAAAARNALTQQELLAKPTAMEPLGDFFQNITAGLAAANYPYGMGLTNPMTGGYKMPTAGGSTGASTAGVRTIQ
jgi:hypothetical protein